MGPEFSLPQHEKCSTEYLMANSLLVRLAMCRKITSTSRSSPGQINPFFTDE